MEKYIKELIIKIDEKDYIYTPLDLCEEMINSIDSLDGDILIIRTLEFLIVLKQKGIDMSNVYYSTNCDIKKQIAVQLGLDINNIYDLDYNKKEVNLGTDMKFDVIVMNSPYNPNSLWKKFTLKAIDTLKEDGQMVSIHPDSWRKKTSHTKLFLHLKEHISELHIKDFNAFSGINISTDWYVYNKKPNDKIKIFYNDGEIEHITKSDITRIFSFSQNSIPTRIINKITKKNYDNNIIIKDTGYYELEHKDGAPYRQCGGRGNGTGWTTGDFILTDEPTKHQFENKVVMSYTRKIRAKYFSKDEQIGVIRANYWLTDNQSIPILLNSKMLWKLFIEIEGEKNLNAHPTWLLKSLNFDGLKATNDKELYEHYNLTQEEINWINE